MTSIDLDKSLEDKRLDDKTKRLFIFCLLMAADDGGLKTSVNQLKEITGLSARSIRTCLKKLEDNNEIALQTTSQSSYICVLKLEDYIIQNDKPKPDETNWIYDHGFGGFVTEECLELRELRIKKSWEENR